MAEGGIDISSEFPKPWTDEIVQAADVVITMGCGDACPIFPGKRYEDWDLDDPAGTSSTPCDRSATRSNGECSPCLTSSTFLYIEAESSAIGVEPSRPIRCAILRRADPDNAADQRVGWS